MRELCQKLCEGEWAYLSQGRPDLLHDTGDVLNTGTVLPQDPQGGSVDPDSHNQADGQTDGWTHRERWRGGEGGGDKSREREGVAEGRRLQVYPT